MLVAGDRAVGEERGVGWKNLGEKPVVDTPSFRLNLAGMGRR